jgi:Fe-S-cluster-containing dehydrogenase component
MAPNENRQYEIVDSSQNGRKHKAAPLKASTCDLCDSAGEETTPYPRCVSACPHDAAHRMTGDELLRLVNRTSGL